MKRDISWVSNVSDDEARPSKRNKTVAYPEHEKGNISWASSVADPKPRPRKRHKILALSNHEKRDIPYLDFCVKYKTWDEVKLIFNELEKARKLEFFLKHIEYKPFKAALEQRDDEGFEGLVNALPKRQQKLLVLHNDHEFIKSFIDQAIKDFVAEKLTVTVGDRIHGTGFVASIANIFKVFINVHPDIQDIICEFMRHYTTKDEIYYANTLRKALSYTLVTINKDKANLAAVQACLDANISNADKVADSIISSKATAVTISKEQDNINNGCVKL